MKKALLLSIILLSIFILQFASFSYAGGGNSGTSQVEESQKPFQELFVKFFTEERHLSPDLALKTYQFVEYSVFSDPLFYRVPCEVNPTYIRYWKDQLAKGKRFSPYELDSVAFFDSPSRIEELDLLFRGQKKFKLRFTSVQMSQEWMKYYDPLRIPGEGTLSHSWFLSPSIDLRVVNYYLMPTPGVDKNINSVTQIMNIEYLISVLRNSEFQQDPENFVKKNVYNPVPSFDIAPASVEEEVKYLVGLYLNNIIRFRPTELKVLMDIGASLSSN